MRERPPFKIEVDWQEAEPDGSECGVREEKIFLKAWTCMVKVPGTPVVGKSKGLICNSCKEALE